MKAVVTSIGEATTDLCIWALKRNGFDVVIYQDGKTLWHKLNRIYRDIDEDFIRVDADVVPNRNLIEDTVKDSAFEAEWWVQFMCYGWFTQGLIHGGVQYIKKEALPFLRKEVGEFMHSERPETGLSRIEAFYNPRRFVSSNEVMGIHGYGQTDIERVKATKQRRGQYDNYDWELVEKLAAL